MNAHNLPLRIPSAEAEPAGLRHDRSSGPAGAHGEFVGQLRAAAGVPRHTGGGRQPQQDELFWCRKVLRSS